MEGAKWMGEKENGSLSSCNFFRQAQNGRTQLKPEDHLHIMPKGGTAGTKDLTRVIGQTKRRNLGRFFRTGKIATAGNGGKELPPVWRELKATAATHAR